MKILNRRKWLPGLILLLGCTLTALMIAFGEEDEMMVAAINPMCVEIIMVKRVNYQIRVPAWGFIEPKETIDIRAEIPGKIRTVPDRIFKGAHVKKGDLLFAIDDRNSKNSHALAAAAKDMALQALEIEKGRQTIARAEWRLLEESKWQGGKNKSLALRQPQLKEREAAVQIAAAKERQAVLDLERTRIHSPCNGVILSENLARGMMLDKGDIGVKIACTDCYYITALFPAEYSIDPGSDSVEITTGSDRYEGNIQTVFSQIHPQTRQKQALVQLKGSQVSIGEYTRLLLPGPSFKNVVLLPEKVIRPGNTVWVLDKDQKLDVRTITILARDMENMVIGRGVTVHDKIIITHIANPLKGMKLSELPHTGQEHSTTPGDPEQ